MTKRQTRPLRCMFACLLGLLVMAVAWSSPLRCAAANAKPAPSNPLYLVGVGPGDPDLITLRAIRVIENADVVFCMESIAAKFPTYLAGKKVIHGYWHLFWYYGEDPSQLKGQERQRCIETARKRDKFITLVRQAVDAGKTVAILDQGDPLLYGPWAWCLEEFEDLHPVVVPGVSCFNAANAALGRGVTSGQHTKSVILTAADWPGKTDTIDKLSMHRATMVLFTMKTDFAEFIDKLSINYPQETPVAVVKHAGYAGKEEVVEATLGTILDRVGQDSLPFEYLIYVGDFLTHRCKKAKGVQDD